MQLSIIDFLFMNNILNKYKVMLIFILFFIYSKQIFCLEKKHQLTSINNKNYSKNIYLAENHNDDSEIMKKKVCSTLSNAASKDLAIEKEFVEGILCN